MSVLVPIVVGASMWAGIVWLFRRNRARRCGARSPLVAAPAVELTLDELFTPRPAAPEIRAGRVATLKLSSGRIVACDHHPVPGSDDNVESGWGDGIYASYFGRGADERIVCLVTSFDVV